MAHTREPKQTAAPGCKRIRGQVEAIEKALNSEQECPEVLQLIAATRGAISGLMNEVVKGQILHHVLSPKAVAAEREPRKS